MSEQNPILDALETSVIIDRKDKPAQVPWTEWRVPVVTDGPSSGSIPMTGPDGLIDPSLLPSASGGTPIITTLTAAQIIGAYQIVAVHSDGMAYLADVNNFDDSSQVIGIAITSAIAPSNTLQVQQVGFLSNLGWNWPTPGATLYLGAGGTLTTTVPVSPGSAFELPMGTVISNNKIEIGIGLPILLA
jgi:hypothetical protein